MHIGTEVTLPKPLGFAKLDLTGGRAMKKSTSIGILISAVIVILIASISGRVTPEQKARFESQAAARETLPDIEAPATSVCVDHLATSRKSGWLETCGELRIGMTSEQVKAILGNPLPIDRSSYAANEVEYWRYFGPLNHDDYVTLAFTNGRLDVIHQRVMGG
jgi:hypothetical protein